MAQPETPVAVKLEQYCSVCKAILEMSVVATSEGDEDGVVWLRCPRCQGYLPKIGASLLAQTEGEGAGERIAAGTNPAPAAPAPVDAPDSAAVAADEAPAEPSAADALADMDVASAVPYRPWNSYEIGAVIHHLAWDDYGIVLAKELIPGLRRVVKVQFEKAGLVRLIEEGGEEP